MQADEKRWKITLVDRKSFTRRPRSKKRRIIKKWRKRPENWTPNMQVITTTLMLGSQAVARAYPDPYWNDANPCHPRILEMHSLLWERIKAEHPDFAARCDVSTPPPFDDLLHKINGITKKELQEL